MYIHLLFFKIKCILIVDFFFLDLELLFDSSTVRSSKFQWQTGNNFSLQFPAETVWDFMYKYSAHAGTNFISCRTNVIIKKKQADVSEANIFTQKQYML